MANESFLIAGGGIAGLAAALGVARNGSAAAVFEQASAFAEIGAGLQLGPNAVAALKFLGAWDAVAPSTFAPRRITIRDGRSGALLLRFTLGHDFETRFGEPYRVIHRADLLAGLLATVRASSGISLNLANRLTGFTETANGVAAEMTAGDNLIGDALIGADGVRSAVRQKLVGDGPPLLAGQVLFRALVPISAAPSSVDASSVSLWLCRRAHVVHYPVSGGKELNIVAAANSAWNNENWATEASPSEVSTHFPSCHRSLDAVLSLPATWTKWAGVWRPPARHWSRGRVTLIGDAAHPMLPFLAQGAAMALEDAAVLSAALAAEGKIATSFRVYENQRLARTARVARMSRRQAYVYHASGPLRLARNLALRLASADAFLARMAWLYGWRPPER